MVVHFTRRIIITLAVYLAAFFAIILLQLSDENIFILHKGAVKINGIETLEENGTRQPLHPLFVSTDGVTFFIDKNTPVIAVTHEKRAIPLTMRSFEQDEGSFTIKFDSGASLSFLDASQSGKSVDDAKVVIQAKIPEWSESLLLGYMLDRGVVMHDINGELVIQDRHGLYTLEGASFDIGSFPIAAPPARSKIEIQAENPRIVYRDFRIALE